MENKGGISARVAILTLFVLVLGQGLIRREKVCRTGMGKACQPGDGLPLASGRAVARASTRAPSWFEATLRCAPHHEVFPGLRPNIGERHPSSHFDTVNGKNCKYALENHRCRRAKILKVEKNFAP